jgi:N-acetylmuramoyl-L-alanine amidase
MVPLRYAVDKLGGETSWEGNRLTALAPLSLVQIRKVKFNIQSALPVHPTISVMDSPNRIIVDIEGAKLTRRTNVDLDGSSRIGQWKSDVVRVVLETNYNPDILARKFDAGTTFEFDTDGVASSPKAQTKQADPADVLQRPINAGPRVPLTQPQDTKYDPASNPDMAPTVIPMIPAGSGLVVGALSVESEGEKSSSFTLALSGKKSMPNVRRPDADVIEITLPQARIADGVDYSLAKGPTIRDVDVSQVGGNVVVRLTLARPMGIEFSLAPAGLQMQLLKPDVGNGRLAGKVVVVDPGHGGHDAGTQHSGISEKNLTLAIGKLLSKELASQGATVIMTRKTDVFIPLNERPAIANRNGADFFVSVHINSNSNDNTASGSITFFHAKDPICQLMADCIQREIVKVNGIGGMGVWSDQRIYNSGFAVLRGAKMPAVLVECGFLNTRKDRARMITDDFQQDIASAIVKGLKAYLGDEGKKK